jgi:hypothetical protein
VVAFLELDRLCSSQKKQRQWTKNEPMSVIGSHSRKEQKKVHTYIMYEGKEKYEGKTHLAIHHVGRSEPVGSDENTLNEKHG